LTRLTNYIEGR
jgi:hypothetical protein